MIYAISLEADWITCITKLKYKGACELQIKWKHTERILIALAIILKRHACFQASIERSGTDRYSWMIRTGTVFLPWHFNQKYKYHSCIRSLTMEMAQQDGNSRLILYKLHATLSWDSVQLKIHLQNWKRWLLPWHCVCIQDAVYTHAVKVSLLMCVN